MEKNKFHILTEGCAAFGIHLNDQQIEQFEIYYEFLVEWNKVMNLTGITVFDEVMLKHFVDSAAIARAINMKEVNTLIDVGTGAGFPGLPLKIIYPHLKVVLLDSLNKRIHFLNEVVDKLALVDVETIHGRAEDAAKKTEYRESFDVAVSRAVANLSSLSEYCIPFVKKCGYFIPYKSGNVEEEAKEAKKAIQVLGGELKKTEKFYLPDSDVERSLLVIEKVKNTPKRYPRKAGIPVKEPIQ